MTTESEVYRRGYVREASEVMTAEMFQSVCRLEIDSPFEIFGDICRRFHTDPDAIIADLVCDGTVNESLASELAEENDDDLRQELRDIVLGKTVGTLALVIALCRRLYILPSSIAIEGDDEDEDNPTSPIY